MSSPLSLRSRAWRGVGCAGALALATQLLAGCYTYVPVDTSLHVPTSTDVAVDITDRGRYELAGAMGPSPRRVEGRLLAATDSTLTVSVRAVEAVGGGSSPWAGEAVVVRRSGVGGVSEKKFSRGRTAMMVLGTLAVVGLLFTVGLSVFGGDESPPVDTGGGGGDTS